MAAQQEPRNGVYYGWDQGDSTWKTNMDGNLRYIGSTLNVSASDLANDPPGSPANGDTIIVDSVPTGDFVGHEDDIAIWFDDDSQWRFFTPVAGLTCLYTGGTLVDQLRAYNGTGWSTNGFAFTF